MPFHRFWCVCVCVRLCAGMTSKNLNNYFWIFVNINENMFLGCYSCFIWNKRRRKCEEYWAINASGIVCGHMKMFHIHTHIHSHTDTLPTNLLKLNQRITIQKIRVILYDRFHSLRVLGIRFHDTFFLYLSLSIFLEKSMTSEKWFIHFWMKDTTNGCNAHNIMYNANENMYMTRYYLLILNRKCHQSTIYLKLLF